MKFLVIRDFLNLNLLLTEVCIIFAIEPDLTAKQKYHNANALALFDPCTKSGKETNYLQ